MGFFIFIVVLIVVMKFVLPPPQMPTKSFFADLTCPPHRWKWLEVKDKDGNIISHKMICEICGPLRNNKDERNEDSDY